MDFKKGKLKSDSLASAVLPAVMIIALTPWKDPQCSLTRIITILNQDFRWKRLFPIFAAIKPWGSSIYFKKLCNPSLYCRVYAVTCRDKSTLVKSILFFCMLTAVIFVVFLNFHYQFVSPQLLRCISYFISSYYYSFIFLQILQSSFSWESSQSLFSDLVDFIFFWFQRSYECPLRCSVVVSCLNGCNWPTHQCRLAFIVRKSLATRYCAPRNVYRNGVHLQIPPKKPPTRPYLLEICTTSREWVTFRPPDRSETQLFFLLASAEWKEMEAGKWSWWEPGRSEMRRASMCYRNGKRWRDKAHVKDTGNEKELQYFQPLVPGAHKDIAWPWQMELHMLAVKPRQTRLYVPSTCGLRITKSRQFGRNGVSMRKVSAGFMGFRSVTGRTTRPRLMYWMVAYIGPPRRRSDTVFFWKNVMRSWIK